jgi:outer membrane protein assembly factor BamD
MKNHLAIGAIIVLFFASCTQYSKALKEKDPAKKLASAVAYYNEQECYKALPMFEELVGLTRGTQQAEEVYYYYAKTHYCLEDYYMGNYYFRSYAKSFPGSPRAEECLFMAALCSYKLSPEFSLDQTDSKTAIDELQFFLDQFPNSALRDSANHMISTLEFKVERKRFEVASLYLKTQKYKAAVSALQEFLKTYPLSNYREEAWNLLVESKFLLAEGSTEAKKLERYRETMESYITFASTFPKSKYLKIAESYYNRSMKMVEKMTK